MVSGDVATGLSLSQAAGWNQTASDWQLFLKYGSSGCWVAVDDGGQVRGTVATITYEDRFAWIGMVLVDQLFQRRGIGFELMRRAIESLGDHIAVKLDATPAGRAVYVRLGFNDEYQISRMEASRIDADKLVTGEVRKLQSDDMDLVGKYDRKVFGASRQSLLKALRQYTPRLSWVSEDKEGVKGYCLGRIGSRFAHIGPVVANDFTTGCLLVSAALKEVEGPVIMDALLHTSQWLSWLGSLGFAEQRRLTRMYRGVNSHPGEPHRQFAILGPEFG